MPDGFDKLRKKQPRNNSRIVIEGVDEPVKPQGKYNDRVRIDPFAPNYRQRPGAPAPTQRT